MTNRKCIICGKPIVLVPSAKERAIKCGGKPSDYTRLFTMHTDCQLRKREQETLELVRRRSQLLRYDINVPPDPATEIKELAIQTALAMQN